MEWLDWSKIQYFDGDEFQCNCGNKYCNPNDHDALQAEPHYYYMAWFVLGHIRAAVGSPMTISRGYSCYEYNKDVGGRVRSYHTIPNNPTDFHPSAVDFRFNKDKFFVQDIVLDLCNPKRIGYHLYVNDKGQWFIHLDFRNYMARWI